MSNREGSGFGELPGMEGGAKAGGKGRSRPLPREDGPLGKNFFEVEDRRLV